MPRVYSRIGRVALTTQLHWLFHTLCHRPSDTFVSRHASARGCLVTGKSEEVVFAIVFVESKGAAIARYSAASMNGDTTQRSCTCRCWTTSRVSQPLMHAKQQALRERVCGDKEKKVWRKDAEALWQDKITGAMRDFESARGVKIKSSNERVSLVFTEVFEDGATVVTAKLCEQCWVDFMNFKALRQFHNDKKTAKRKQFEDGTMTELRERMRQKISKDVCKEGILHNDDGTMMTIYQARKAMKGTLNLTEEQLQLLCVGSSPLSREAYYFMKSFFPLVCDKAPNRENLCQIPGIYTKDSIYQVFVKHAKFDTAREAEPMSQQSFEKLWLRVFPRVKISKYCQVGGKCKQCHCLYERLSYFKSAAD